MVEKINEGNQWVGLVTCHTPIYRDIVTRKGVPPITSLPKEGRGRSAPRAVGAKAGGAGWEEFAMSPTLVNGVVVVAGFKNRRHLMFE
jgi:hypothetical protein